MKNQTLPLLEYNFLFVGSKDSDNNRAIKKTTFEQIENFVLKNSDTVQYLKIAHKRGYGKVLQAQNYVGVIQTKDGTTIEILPKVQSLKSNDSKEILLKMLKTLRKSPFKNFNMAHLKNHKMPLLEVFITMFLDELSTLIRKGIRSDYIKKEENLKFLKGKLNINEQIRKNYIHKERFFVDYEEFSSDRVENRLIKTTLNYLYNKSKSNKNQQRIREYLFVFDDIGLSHNIKTDFSKVKSNRQMREYKQVLLWCKTFLLGESFSPYKGDDLAFALLFDMNKLFENYVFHYLKKNCNCQSITAQDKKYHLVEKPKSFELKPDIAIEHHSKLIIADTKWKILSEEKTNAGVSQADMYQLFAYGIKYEKCKQLYLIYPKDKDVKGKRYKYQDNLYLNVVFFDVEKDCFTCKDKKYK